MPLVSALVTLASLATLAAAPPAARADPFAHCDAQLARAPQRWESARCYFDAGRSQGLWEEAAERLAVLERQPPSRPWLALARAYVERERSPAEAWTWHRRALAAFAAARHVDGEVRARCAFSDWLAFRGERDAAKAELDRAVRSAEAAGNPGALAEARIFQARHLRNAGTNLPEAYRLTRGAEEVLFPSGDPVRQILCLELLARLDRELGHAQRAQSRYRRLEALARAQHRLATQATAQSYLGLLLLEELDRAPRPSGRERTLQQLRSARQTAREVGDLLTEAANLSNLSLVLPPEERRETLERCLELVRGRSQAVTAACQLGLARLDAEGTPAAARSALEEARRAAESSGDLNVLATFTYGQMNLRWQLGPPEAALAATDQAIRAVEALRDRQSEQAGRAGLFSRWLSPYYAASGHLLRAFQRSRKPEDLDRGFAFTEALRARVLRDLLAARGRPEPPVGLATLERTLAPDEAILSFQIAPRRDLYGFAGGPWLLVVTRTGTIAYPLPEAAERARLESSVSALLGVIGRREAPDGSASAETPLATALGRTLLSSALAHLPSSVRRLVILPDGVLHLLPFAALRVGPEAEPLARRYRVTVASSATLWERWRRQPRRARRAALVLADPALPSVLAQAARREGTQEGRLPGARREGRQLQSRLGGGSLLRIGAEAGEAFLKRQDLTRFGLLHFATHAVADEDNPDASAVLLAADAPGEDGRLQVDEIAKLDLRGALVALSSCRSASGALVGGEGVMSLSRAFFAAGASVVVGSLWPVRDDDAAAFFEVFYDRLGQGANASQAFAEAQRQRLEDGAPTEAWAGFVLAGDGEWKLPPAPPQREAKPRPAVLGLYLGAVLLLGLGPVLFAFRPRRR